MRGCLLGLVASLVCACSGASFDVTNTDGGGDANPADGGSDGGGDVGGESAGDSGGDDVGVGDVGRVPITIVQATDTRIVPFGTKTDPTLSFATRPAAGNAVILGISCFSEVDNCTIPTTGVTDTNGNTWLRVVEGVSIVSSTTHGARGYIFIAPQILSGTGAFTITVDANGDPTTVNQGFVLGAIEVAGLLSVDPVDRTGRTLADCCAASTTVATTFPTTLANELAVAVHTERSNDADVGYVFEPGWTQHHVNTDGVTANPHSMVSKVLTTTGVVTHKWTHDPPLRGTTAIIATFKGRAP